MTRHGSPASGLDPADRLLVRLAATVAAPDRGVLRAAAASVVQAGLQRGGEEVLLQSHLFAGYPAALGAFTVWREVAGSDVHAPDEALEPGAARTRGERVCRVVYGRQYGSLRANVAALHPALERWMLEDGYGRVLGRPGLALPVRELCVVALTAGLDAPRQLYSHLRGALQAGATPEMVDDALGEAAAVHDGRRAGAAAAIWRDVRARADGGASTRIQDGRKD